MSENFNILIAYDGSSFADAALDDLKNAGLPEKVEVLVLSVAEVWMPPHQEGEKLKFITEDLQKRYEKNLEIENVAKQISNRAAERIRTMFPDWSVSAESTYGSPAWEILACAEDFKPDLIVVGAQGVFGLEKLLIGSVAQKIVTEVGC
jgi:nucleotide-binding universal stress UspA family protein